MDGGMGAPPSATSYDFSVKPGSGANREDLAGGGKRKRAGSRTRAASTPEAKSTKKKAKKRGPMGLEY